MKSTIMTAGETATTVTNLNNLVEDVKIAEELVSETICEEANIDVWRDVEGFEGKYEVSFSGHLRFADKKDKKKVKCSQNGNYITALLYHKGNDKPTYVKIHMLVAIAFVPNPEGYTYVRHKNGKLDDNRAENLEWVETKPAQRRRKKIKPTLKTKSASPILEVSDSEVLEGDVLENNVLGGDVPEVKVSDDDSLDGDVSESEVVEGELWKDIKGLEGLYKISKGGMVCSFCRKKPKCLKARVNSTKNGGHMLSYQLRGKDGKKHHKLVHMLVAEHFVPNPLSYKFVMHIDGNPKNNNADNLRWTERFVQCRAKKSEDYKKLEGKRNLMTTQGVEQYYADGTYINSFKSIAEAAEKTKCSYGSIKKVLDGKESSIGGYVWKYSGNVYQTHLNRTIVEKHILKVSIPNWVHKVDKFITFFNGVIDKARKVANSFFDNFQYTSVLTGGTTPNL
mgnify:CR=1 FL=1